MKTIVRTKALIATTAALTSLFCGFTAKPGIAGEIVTTTTSSGGQVVLINRNGLQPMLVPTTISAFPTPFVTTTSTLEAITLYNPDDLITRRNELLARIANERASGKLMPDQAAALINRISCVDAARANLVRGDSVSYLKEVKRLYRDYDRVSNQIFADSHEGNKQLAGKYSCIVF